MTMIGYTELITKDSGEYTELIREDDDECAELIRDDRSG